MKSGRTIIFIFICMLFLSSCTMKAKYKFMHDPSTITKIEIVHIDNIIETKGVESTTLATITDTNAFLKDFEALSCYLIYTDPKGIDNGSDVIKITYDNNDYELIDCAGTSKFTSEGGFMHNKGYRYFADEEFSALINKYK